MSEKHVGSMLGRKRVYFTRRSASVSVHVTVVVHQTSADKKYRKSNFRAPDVDTQIRDYVISFTQLGDRGTHMLEVWYTILVSSKVNSW